MQDSERAQKMSDLELRALIALVENDTADVNHQMARYGELMHAPDVAAVARLREVLVDRGVLPEDRR